MAFKTKKEIHTRRAKRTIQQIHEKSRTPARTVDKNIKELLKNPETVEELRKMAECTAWKLSKSFCLAKDNLSCQNALDRAQDAWVTMLLYSKDNLSFAKRNIFWGVIASIRKDQKIRAEEGRMRHKKPKDTIKDHEWWKKEPCQVPDRTKNGVYLSDCRDTIKTLIKMAKIKPKQIHMYIRNIAFGEEATKIAKEDGLTGQTVGKKIERITEKLQRIARRRHIPNPMDDYYKIKKGTL